MPNTPFISPPLLVAARPVPHQDFSRKNPVPSYCLELIQALVPAESPAHSIILQKMSSLVQAGGTLGRAFAALNAEEQGCLKQAVGEANLAEILSVATNREPNFLWEDVLALGIRLKQGGQFARAATLFQALSQDFIPETLRQKATRELDAMLGKGSAGMRAEFLLSRFSQEATDYRMIVPMMLGTAVSSLARSASLARLAGLSEDLWYARGFSARVTAASVAFAAEVPTFTLASRALKNASNGGAEDTPHLTQDLATSALTLGLFKFSGYLSETALLKMQGIPHESWSRTLLTQTSMFGGLLLSRSLEERLGWRPRLDGATPIIDTLSSLLTLGVGAHLGNRALGGNFAELQTELGLRIAQSKSRKDSPFGEKLFFPVFAMASSGNFGDGKGGGVTELSDPPSLKSFSLENLAKLKQALFASKEDKEQLPNLITRLMQVAFSSNTPREVRNEAGRTLFKEGHFQTWQELLIAKGKSDIAPLRGLSKEILIDAADKCLCALEQMAAREDDLAVAQLLGPVVYMAYASAHEPSQKKLGDFLLAYPRPFVRVGALIHQYPGLRVPVVRVMQWDQYERVLTFNDLLSENPSSHTLAKGLLKNLEQSERASGTEYPVIRGVLDALGNPTKLARLYMQLVPENSIKREGVEAQVNSLLGLPLVLLQKEKSAQILREIAEKTLVKVRETSFSDLSALFSKEGLSVYPHGVPMKLFPEIVSQVILSMATKREIRQTDVPALVTAYQQLFHFLDGNLQVARGTEPGYLHFVDPFTN